MLTVKVREKFKCQFDLDLNLIAIIINSLMKKQIDTEQGLSVLMLLKKYKLSFKFYPMNDKNVLVNCSNDSSISKIN